MLQQFVGRPEIEPPVARDRATLVLLVRWAATIFINPVSQPANRTDQRPRPPAPTDVW